MNGRDDARHMAHALTIGARGLGNAWPNPAVGCVIVKEDRIVGRGWTRPGGRPHAETEALAQAGEAARGATVYVTLEPCAHHGKTPPCAEALIAAGVARVVTATGDPDPKVGGRGHALLREAGIAVVEGVMEPSARRAHRGFFSSLLAARPMVTLKLATSFDGRIATASGESRWITGADARRRVHAERMRHDLVLVGGGTARADDPDLSARDMGAVPQPVRCVVSRRLNVPLHGRLIKSVEKGPVWAIVDGAPGAVEDAALEIWRGQGGEIIAADVGRDGRMDPGAVLRQLGARGITRVFCEGGGALAASFLAAGLVDEILGFTAGVMLGAEGRPALGALGVDALADAPRFRLLESEAVGGDILHRWERVEG